MRRHELRVEQPVTAEPQPRHEMNQRDLAGVADPAEHALAEKRRAERDPVQPADKLAVVPALDAVRRAAVEQRGVEAHDLLVDPGRRARFAGFGAAPHHRLESGVEAHRKDRRAAARACRRRGTCKPSSGRMPRRFGSTQNSSGSSADSAIGKMPAA